jgi:hypothetical protein
MPLCAVRWPGSKGATPDAETQRRSCQEVHRAETLRRTEVKQREFVHTNYLDYTAVTEAFRAVDACLFCLGTSVTQVSKEELVKIARTIMRSRPRRC